jgi:hypothetical protein
MLPPGIALSARRGALNPIILQHAIRISYRELGDRLAVLRCDGDGVAGSVRAARKHTRRQQVLSLWRLSVVIRIPGARNPRVSREAGCLKALSLEQRSAPILMPLPVF